MKHASSSAIRVSVLVICSSLAAACTSDEMPWSRDTEAIAVRASTVFVDPVVMLRARSGDLQRVIVTIDDPGKDRAIVEPSSEHRPARASELQRSLRTRVKDRVVDGVSAASPDPVAVAHWYPPFPLMALDVTPAQVEALTRAEGVVRVEADRLERPALSTSLPAIAGPWFHQSRGSGQGVSVAVLDTPVRYDNGHFGSCPYPGASGCSVTVSQNFSPQTQQEVIAAEDTNGTGSHGTNVAAIVHGVAPEAGIIGLNVFYWSESESGMRSSVSDQLDALAWVADNAASHDIVAVNMSIGGDPEGIHTCNDTSRYDAVRTLWDEHGILSVISSGNDGEQNAVSPPGCISIAVTVGAHFDTELASYDGSCTQTVPLEHEIACFSNLSGMVDILAPGVFIDAGGYRKSGTSMAAPHVAGAIAAWQSWYLADEGAVRSPFWMHKRLLMESSAPHVHSDGRRYQRLDFAESVQWDYGRSFPYWYRETDDNAIPSGAWFETTFDVTGQGWDVGSAYLVLDLVHPQPEHLMVRVEGPGNKVASVELPKGQAHFTGVVGRTVEPGGLSSLAGAPVDGTWRLRLRDSVGAHDGHYLQAAMYFVREGTCSPDCSSSGCGDDTCGGACPFCLISGTCYAEGDPHPSDECRGCDPAMSDKWWSPLQGVTCDDGFACTQGDRCESGKCEGDPIACPPPPVCHGSGRCVEPAGSCEYAPLPDGEACSDGDVCTAGDACESGACVGAPMVCDPPNPCMRSDGCDPASGECRFSPAADGTTCESGTCQGGSCVAPGGGTPGVDAGVDPGPAGGGDSSDSGGCGCRVRAVPMSGGAWLVLLAVILAVARRRES